MDNKTIELLTMSEEGIELENYEREIRKHILNSVRVPGFGEIGSYMGMTYTTTSNPEESTLTAKQLIDCKRTMDKLWKKHIWLEYAHLHAIEWSRNARQRVIDRRKPIDFHYDSLIGPVSIFNYSASGMT